MAWDTTDWLLFGPLLAVLPFAVVENAGLWAGWAWVYKLGIPLGSQRETVDLEVPVTTEEPDIFDEHVVTRWLGPEAIAYFQTNVSMSASAGSPRGGVGTTGWLCSGLIQIRREPGRTHFVGRRLARLTPPLSVVALCIGTYFGLGWGEGGSLAFRLTPIVMFGGMYLAALAYVARKLPTSYQLITADLVARATR